MDSNAAGWKLTCLGLAVALVVAETSRENAIIRSEKRLRGMGYALQVTDGYAFASGQWKRSDGGSPILEGATAIECVKERGTCTESIAIVDRQFGFVEVDVDDYDITEFSDSAIRYQSDPKNVCATYQVRMDIGQHRVTATRDKKTTAAGLCNGLEDRVEMELSDGKSVDDSSIEEIPKGRFMPISHLLKAIFS